LDCQHQQCNEYINEALVIAHQLQDQQALAFLYADQLMLATVQGKVENMYQILSHLLIVLPKIKGTILYYYLMGYLLSFLSSAFDNKDYHVKAIHYNYLCLQLIEQIPAADYKKHFFFDIKTKTLSNLAYSFMVLERYDEAETHLHLAEYFVTDLAALPDRIELYHWQARLYEKQQRYEEALLAANQSINLSTQCDYPVLRNAITYAIKGRLLVKTKQNYHSAIDCFERATQVAESFNFWLAMGNNYEHQAHCYELLEDYQKSSHFYRLACQAQRKTSLNYLNQTFRLIRAQLELAISNISKPYFKLKDDFDKPAVDIPNIYTQTLAIFEFIYTHYHNTKLSIDSIATHFNLSTRTVTRRLIHLFDMTAVQIITLARLKKAYVLLTTSKLSILDIAEKVGIDHQSYFSVSFRKQYGKSPTSVRRQHL
jgi:AraC-like DNA-binding protein